MRARRLLEAIADWVSNPGRGALFYSCRGCGEGFDAPRAECPDCGGSVVEVAAEPSPPYVGPLG